MARHLNRKGAGVDEREFLVCTKCLVKKRVAEFYRKGDRPHSWCKRCFNAYCIQRWIDRKIFYVEMLGDRCLDCGSQFHYAVYDFHHLKNKDFKWQQLRLRSDVEIRRELAKCVLLCANCHRLRHVSDETN